jgi:hypothetical protein
LPLYKYHDHSHSCSQPPHLASLPGPWLCLVSKRGLPDLGLLGYMVWSNWSLSGVHFGQWLVGLSRRNNAAVLVGTLQVPPSRSYQRLSHHSTPLPV